MRSVNGPLGFMSMTWAAAVWRRSLSGEIKDILNDDPSTTIILSPGWAKRHRYGDALFSWEIHYRSNLTAWTPSPSNTATLLRIRSLYFHPRSTKPSIESPKFQEVQVEKDSPVSDGKPGFYFLRLRYSDRIDEILVEEAEARRVLATETLPLPDKSVVEVSYPVLDMGEIKNILDDEKTSLIRTMEANPLVLKFRFEQPQTMKGVDVLVGSAATRYTARIWTEGESDPRIFQTEERGKRQPRHACGFWSRFAGGVY